LVDRNVSFYGVYDGEKILFNGYCKRNTLTAIITQQYDEGADVFYAVYSQNYDSSYDLGESIDVTGSWKAYEHCYMMADGVKELRGDDLTITERGSHVFIGTMEQTIGSDVVEVDVVGVLGGEYGGKCTGYLVSEDENWSISTDGESLILRTVMGSDVDVTEGESAAVSRSYSRDGNVVDEDIPDLVGTAWYMDSYYWTEKDNNGGYDVFEGVFSSAISIDEQDGALFSGTYVSNGNTGDLLGFVIGGQIGVYICDLDYVIFSMGLYDGSTLEMTNWYSYGSGYYTERIIFTAEEDPTESPLGHWYNSNTYSMDSEGNKEYVTSIDDSSIIDLDVFSIEDGLVWGSFDNCYFSGTFTSNLKFTIKTDGYSLDFVGYLGSNNMMYSSEIYTYSDRTCLVRSSTYCLDPIYSWYNTDVEDIVGDWISPEGCSTTLAEGERYVLEGEGLTVHSYGNIIYGTIEEDWGYVETVSFLGTAFYIENEKATLVEMIDENGAIMRGSVFDDVLTLVAFYDNGEVMSMVERIYTRDGSTPVIDVEDISGTVYSVDSLNYLWTANGSRSGGSCDYSIEITCQYGDMVYGQFNADVVHEFFGRVIYSNNVFTLLQYTISEYPDNVGIIYISQGKGMMTSVFGTYAAYLGELTEE